MVPPLCSLPVDRFVCHALRAAADFEACVQGVEPAFGLDARAMAPQFLNGHSTVGNALVASPRLPPLRWRAPPFTERPKFLPPRTWGHLPLDVRPEPLVPVEPTVLARLLATSASSGAGALPTRVHIGRGGDVPTISLFFHALTEDGHAALRSTSEPGLLLSCHIDRLAPSGAGLVYCPARRSKRLIGFPLGYCLR